MGGPRGGGGWGGLWPRGGARLERGGVALQWGGVAGRQRLGLVVGGHSGVEGVVPASKRFREDDRSQRGKGKNCQTH